MSADSPDAICERCCLPATWSIQSLIDPEVVESYCQHHGPTGVQG